MVDPTQAIAWCLAELGDNELEIAIDNSLSQILTGFFEVSSSIKWNSCNLASRGWGRSQDEALLKCLSELIERIYFHESLAPTSSGFASHLDYDQASFIAQNELIERDLFLCHFYTNQSFRPISASRIPAECFEIQSWCKDLRIPIEFYELGPTGCVANIDGRLFKRPFGFATGTSIKTDFSSACFHAAVEALRNAQPGIHAGDQPSLSLSEFQNIRNPSFSDHGKLSLNTQYANLISFLFDGSALGQSNNADLIPHDFEMIKLHEKIPIFKECPFFVVQALEPNLQGLFEGPTTDQNLNLERLSKFSGRRLRPSDVQNLPHPFN